MKRAIQMYETFHSYEPRRIGRFPRAFSIPDEVTLAGDALYVLYRSGKVDPATGRKPSKPVDYIHKHDAGVKIYRPDLEAGRPRAVPQWILRNEALVLLGDCLGFAYRDRSGEEIEAQPDGAYPELYTVPNGKALLVIEGKRSVVAMLWGGKLGVESRGIVH